MILAVRGSGVWLRLSQMPLIMACQSNPRWELPHVRFRVECLKPGSATLPKNWDVHNNCILKEVKFCLLLGFSPSSAGRDDTRCAGSGVWLRLSQMPLIMACQSNPRWVLPHFRFLVECLKPCSATLPKNWNMHNTCILKKAKTSHQTQTGKSLEPTYFDQFSAPFLMA